MRASRLGCAAAGGACCGGRARAGAAVGWLVPYLPREGVRTPPMPLLFQRQIGVERRPIPIHGIRKLLNAALAGTGLTDASGKPLNFTPPDFRRLFITDAVTTRMPPPLAHLVALHADVHVTLACQA